MLWRLRRCTQCKRLYTLELNTVKKRAFREEITYLMMCTDVNNDGKVDYMEFTERFHNPARDIGRALQYSSKLNSILQVSTSLCC